MNETISLYWWAKKPNFGDGIGPWLVEMMTGRPVRNIRGAPGGETGLATVGSLIHSLDRAGLSIWGSGSIGSLSADQAKKLRTRQPAAIHAVRGWKTYKEITGKLGWRAPKIYGDPALLLPRFHSPGQASGSGKIAIVPHYTHKKYFSDFDTSKFNVIDVQQEPKPVVDQIANAKCCIATSLHAVIVAHAYGVPWVRLRIQDQPLLGGDFKFEDFYTTIKADEVVAATVFPEEIDDDRLEQMARTARVPAKKLSFDPLLDAFPYERARL